LAKTLYNGFAKTLAEPPFIPDACLALGLVLAFVLGELELTVAGGRFIHWIDRSLYPPPEDFAFHTKNFLIFGSPLSTNAILDQTIRTRPSLAEMPPVRNAPRVTVWGATRKVWVWGDHVCWVLSPLLGRLPRMFIRCFYIRSRLIKACAGYSNLELLKPDLEAAYMCPEVFQ
jgi:hypothetical protein